MQAPERGKSMEDTEYIGSQQRASQIDTNGSMEYMLNEIEYARQAIHSSTQRFENQISYYMAGLAAISSSIACR
jgi:hypothetical protein